MTSISLRRIFPAALFLATIVCTADVSAQLRSITVYSEYASPLAKRLDVQRADAVGGGVDISYSVLGNFCIGLRGGYALYAIDQTDQLNRWGWTFWNDRYLNKIQADMRADPSLSTVIGSVQKMDLIPATLHLDYVYEADERLMITPSISGGVSFYTRRLFADETWTKTFPAADYSFTYNFRNYAPMKKGNVLHAGFGCVLQYRVFTDVDVSAGAFYTLYAATGNKDGYAAFPFENEANIRLGLNFMY
jgi:hypothetical protein